MTLREIYTYISSGKLEKFCKYKSIADINIRLKEHPVINSCPRHIYHLTYDDLLRKIKFEIARLYLINEIETMFSDRYDIQLTDLFDTVFYINDLPKQETDEE